MSKLIARGFVFLIVFIALCHGDDGYFHRSCDFSDRPPVANFDIERYMGVWYEISRYNTSVVHSDCLLAVTEQLNKTDYSLAFYFKTLPGTDSYTMSSNASMHSTDGGETLDGRVTITVPNHDGLDPPTFDIHRRFLATDYDNYAIIWSCEDIDTNLSLESAWIIARTPQLNSDVLTDVNNYIDRYLVRDILVKTEQNESVCHFEELHPVTKKEISVK